RNNHIAIGAGSHKSLSATSGVAFERIYNDGTTKDKVICCIAASKNSNVVITVNKTDFPDGTVLKNTYDNTEATVSGGKVTFASGANGTILLEVVSGNEEESSETTPIPSSSETTPIPSSSETTPVPSSSVTTDPSSSETTPVPSSSETTPVPSSSETIPAGTLILGDVNLDDEISIKDATEIQKHIALLSSISAKGLQCADVNGDGYVNVKDGTAIQKYLAKIDTGYAIGCPLGTPSSDPTKATTAPASSETSESSTAATQGTTIPETTVTQPSSSSSDKFTYKDGYVYLYNAASWQDVYVHYWSDASGSSWPGDEMTLVTTINGVGVYEAPVGSENTGLVFNNNGNGLQTANLEYTTGMAYDNKAKNWIDISNLGEGNTNPSSETTDTGDTKKITLVDATPEVWLGHDSAVLVLEDVSTGATYEMTSSGSNSWYAVVPTSVTNIKFNRNDPNTGKTWNSWNAGQCGDNDTYTATSSGVGSWSKGVASSAAANPFVLISPFAFLVNLVLG
ncbi:MAG: starch-binding protein, partial [Acutalibacteraceae bacterium]